MTFRPERVLVTGACGFIGSHLVEALVRAGHTVRALAYYNAQGSWGWLDHVDPHVQRDVEVVLGDIRDAGGVREIVRGCDAVLNLAALIAIPYSYRSPGSYVDTNVTGTLNLLQASRDLGVQRFVHTSTSEVYGTAQFVPITEAHPLRAQSPYAATKIAADQLALSFHLSFDMPVTTLRPFNTYGPRQSARAVLPTIITQLLAGKTRIRLGSLHPTRDFNYVADTAQAFIAIMGADAAIGEVVNIGSDTEVSIGDAAEIVASVIGTDLEIETDEARVRPEGSEVERLWADNARARAHAT